MRSKDVLVGIATFSTTLVLGLSALAVGAALISSTLAL